MIKRVLVMAGFALLLIWGQLSLASAGPIFNVTATRSTLTINPIEKGTSYQSVGIKLNTPGYQLTNTGNDCRRAGSGYCLFSVSDAASKKLSFTGPGGVLNLTLCLKENGQTCQDYKVTLGTEHVIFVTTKTYLGNMNGVAGADIICQDEAYQKGSIIPQGLTFKALLVTTSRYPCNASGRCGGTNASDDWPLRASTPYYNPDLTLFNTVNNNFVFDGQSLKLQLANGVSVENGKSFWSGVQSVKSNKSGNDIVGWASADANKAKDGRMYALYSPFDCVGFTSSSRIKTGSAGQVGARAGFTDGTAPGDTWGNYFGFSDSNPVFLFNMWVTGEVLVCNASAVLICVSHQI